MQMALPEHISCQLLKNGHAVLQPIQGPVLRVRQIDTLPREKMAVTFEQGQSNLRSLVDWYKST